MLYCSKGDNNDDVETKKQCQKAPGAIFNINYKEDNKQANSVRQCITERRPSTINSSQSHTAKTSIAQSFFFTERLAHMVVANAAFITNTHYHQRVVIVQNLHEIGTEQLPSRERDDGVEYESAGVAGEVNVLSRCPTFIRAASGQTADEGAGVGDGAPHAAVAVTLGAVGVPDRHPGAAVISL